MIYIIILLGLLIIAGVVAIIMMNKRQREMQGYYSAAEKIYRDKLLMQTMKNPYLNDNSNVENSSMFIHMKVCNTRPLKSYVYCVGDSVRVGRSRGQNELILSDIMVSERHCIIYSANDGVYLQDLNSANGTYIKRGLLKKTYNVTGQNVALQDSDIVVIGSTALKITLFSVNVNLFS